MARLDAGHHRGMRRVSMVAAASLLTATGGVSSRRSTARPRRAALRRSRSPAPTTVMLVLTPSGVNVRSATAWGSPTAAASQVTVSVANSVVYTADAGQRARPPPARPASDRSPPARTRRRPRGRHCCCSSLPPARQDLGGARAEPHPDHRRLTEADRGAQPRQAEQSPFRGAAPAQVETPHPGTEGDRDHAAEAPAVAHRRRHALPRASNPLVAPGPTSAPAVTDSSSPVAAVIGGPLEPTGDNRRGLPIAVGRARRTRHGHRMGTGAPGLTERCGQPPQR